MVQLQTPDLPCHKRLEACLRSIGSMLNRLGGSDDRTASFHALET